MPPSDGSEVSGERQVTICGTQDTIEYVTHTSRIFPCTFFTSHHVARRRPWLGKWWKMLAVNWPTFPLDLHWYVHTAPASFRVANAVLFCLSLLLSFFLNFSSSVCLFVCLPPPLSSFYVCRLKSGMSGGMSGGGMSMSGMAGMAGMMGGEEVAELMIPANKVGLIIGMYTHTTQQLVLVLYVHLMSVSICLQEKGEKWSKLFRYIYPLV